MSTVLIVASGLTGLLHATDEAARRLSKAGHTVHYASPLQVKNKLGPHIEEFHALPARQRRLVPKLARLHPVIRLVAGTVGFSGYRHQAIQALAQAPYRDLLARIRPDIVLVDLELHEYVLTTHAAGVPYLLVSPWFQNVFMEHMPPLTVDRPPGAAEAKASGHGPGLRQWSGWAGWQDRRSILLDQARRAGFDSDKLTVAGWPPPITFRQVPILHFVLREMDFPYPVPGYTHYVGPMVRAMDWQMVDGRLRTMVDGARSAGKKIIYASATTMQAGGQDRATLFAAAVRSRPDWFLILTGGGKNDFPTVTENENVAHFDWVPQTALLTRVDCCINHAGIGTINECVFLGVPMVIYSGGKHDQPGCTARLRYHGLAVVGERDDSPEAVAGRIEQALTLTELRRKVARYRDLARDGAVRDRLVSVVEACLASQAQSAG
ncbi:glycosyltransferase [Lewinella sp. IMCC34183]|uniref:glycosyltransferase n=1 Tax=Lewinella sp. IMCC34183 TaxID=2248762 RepID=UPI000E27AFC0|nr:glycosyltransferase [Lewinella sp. IMCC34183]